MPLSAAILVIDDEPQIRRFLRAGLSSNGYHVIEAANGMEGTAAARAHTPDVILLDLGLPDLDGVRVIELIRESMNTPVIVISARGQEADKVAALDASADDYVTKPFGMSELIARINVAVRHSLPAGAKNQVFESGELKVDFAQRLVHMKDREIKLTPLEFKLLMLFIQHTGKVLTHRFILRAVWGPHHEDENQYLRVFMHALRRKLESDPARPKYITTETGIGYRFKT